MEDLSDLGGHGHPGAAAWRPAAPSLASSSKVSVQVYTVPSSAATGREARGQGVAPMMHASSVAGHGGRAADLDPVKAKIVSHPSYHRLLAAFLDCHKARAPIDDPSTLARARARVRSCCCYPS